MGNAKVDQRYELKEMDHILPTCQGTFSSVSDVKNAELARQDRVEMSKRESAPLPCDRNLVKPFAEPILFAVQR